MKFYEQLIHFQNQAEKDFKQQKTVPNTIRYALAFISFLASSIIAGITMPIRMLTKQKRMAQEGIIEVNEQNIEAVLSEDRMILLDFWAEWCGPCVMMSGTLKAFSENQHKVLIGKINADKNSQLLKRYSVKGLPQFILLQNGREIQRHAGAMTLVELKAFTSLS